MTGALPWIGAGLQFVKRPKEFLSDLRTRHGDVFLVHMWGSKFLFTFSPDGLKRLYQVPEVRAHQPSVATRSTARLSDASELVVSSLSLTVLQEEASFPRATRSFLGLKVPMELLDNFITVEKGWKDVFTQAMKRQLMDRCAHTTSCLSGSMCPVLIVVPDTY